MSHVHVTLECVRQQTSAHALTQRYSQHSYRKHEKQSQEAKTHSCLQFEHVDAHVGTNLLPHVMTAVTSSSGRNGNAQQHQRECRLHLFFRQMDHHHHHSNMHSTTLHRTLQAYPHCHQAPIPARMTLNMTHTCTNTFPHKSQVNLTSRVSLTSPLLMSSDTAQHFVSTLHLDQITYPLTFSDTVEHSYMLHSSYSSAYAHGTGSHHRRSAMHMS